MRRFDLKSGDEIQWSTGVRANVTYVGAKSKEGQAALVELTTPELLVFLDSVIRNRLTPAEFATLSPHGRNR